MLSEDKRDLRDPQRLGEILLEQAKSVRSTYGGDIPLSEIYDVHVQHFDIPLYDKHETMQVVAQREYEAECALYDKTNKDVGPGGDY